MFLTKQIQYSLITIAGIALVGCSSPRTIMIKPSTQPIIGGAVHTRQSPIIQDGRVVHYPPSQEIKTRVEVPKDIIPHVEPTVKVAVPRNRPTIDIKRGNVGTTPTGKNIDRLNGEVMERIPFPLDEYKSLKKIGRSTVSGKVFIVNSMTDAEVLGKNLKLYLNPVTSYSTQWYNESYLSGYKMSKVDKRLYNYLKFSTSNSNGEFDFYGIAKGRYYLIGSIMCGQECGLGSIEKIRLVKEIYVGSGVTKINLTKRVP